MSTSTSKHLLHVQRKAKKARVTDPFRRKQLGFSSLKTLVKSTSSPNTTKSSKYLKSPALQKSTSVKKISPLITSNTTVNFFRLPYDIKSRLYKDAFYQNEYILRKWIDLKKINLNILSKNPNSISFFDKMFKLNPDAVINWYELSNNPNAIELIKKKIKYEKKQNLSNLRGYQKINYKQLSRNPNAIELLEQKIKEEKANPQRILTDNEKIDWDLLCQNPNAIELLKANREKLTKYIFDNKNLDQEFIKSLLEQNIEIPWTRIWSKPKVIRLLLQKYPDRLEYGQLSENTSFKAIQLLTAKIIKEKELTENVPKVYEELPYRKKISWNILSRNPKAIELLTAKALEEKKLREKDTTLYYNLLCRINWAQLSFNPNGIKLLEEKAIEEKELREKNPELYKSINPTLKIDWQNLSRNPKAIKLLETKAIEEKELRENFPEKYKSLKNTDKIHWENLSANPKAIQLLEKYPEYIDLIGICRNPNAVKLIRKNIDNITDWYYLSSNPCIFIEK